jgi:hypothetical protein
LNATLEWVDPARTDLAVLADHLAGLLLLGLLNGPLREGTVLAFKPRSGPIVRNFRQTKLLIRP